MDGACNVQTNGLSVWDISSKATTLHGAGKALDDILPGDVVPSHILNRHRVDWCFWPTLHLDYKSIIHQSCAYHAISHKENEITHPLATPWHHFGYQRWQQRGSSNTRIMADLLKNGQLRPDKIDYYLMYTTTIFEYHELYHWRWSLNLITHGVRHDFP